MKRPVDSVSPPEAPPGTCSPQRAELDVQSSEFRVQCSKFEVQLPTPNFRRSTLISQLAAFLFLIVCVSGAFAAAPDALFRTGADAYHAADYAAAAAAFRQAAALRPASGTLLNLGNAEWQLGRSGPAILAWEQALVLDPLNESARGNLRFARKNAQLETPELTWCEAVASWLPLNWWPWFSGVSLWLVVGMGLLPGIFRLRKASWHQALAAFGLAVFLLSLPAHFGLYTRSQIGFVLQKDTPLRLTPTSDAQYVTRLSAGEPARVQRARGRYLLIRTNRAVGWVERDHFGLTSSTP